MVRLQIEPLVPLSQAHPIVTGGVSSPSGAGSYYTIHLQTALRRNLSTSSSASSSVHPSLARPTLSRRERARNRFSVAPRPAAVLEEPMAPQLRASWVCSSAGPLLALLLAATLLAPPTASARPLSEMVSDVSISGLSFPYLPIASVLKLDSSSATAASRSYVDTSPTSSGSPSPTPTESPSTASPSGVNIIPLPSDGSNSSSSPFPAPAVPTPPTSETSPTSDGSTNETPTTALVQATAPAPAPSQPPPPPPYTGCPPRPDLCDFYFQGYADSLPSFKVSDGVGDTAISPPIQGSVRGSTVDVLTANSQTSDYICQDGVNPTGPLPDQVTPGVSPDNQFYASQDVVAARTFQPAAGGTAPYLGKYVRLNLTSAQLNVFDMLTNLNPGEYSEYFPEDRRCVVFQISDS